MLKSAPGRDGTSRPGFFHLYLAPLDRRGVVDDFSSQFSDVPTSPRVVESLIYESDVETVLLGSSRVVDMPLR
jgi:hypothetical protein